MAESTEGRFTQVNPAPTLGEMAEVMRGWQAQGVTLASVRYVIGQVFHKELDAEHVAARERGIVLRAEARAAVTGIIDKHSPTL